MPKGAAKHDVHTRWWRQEGADLANEVVSICNALESDYAGRRQRALWSLCRYENRDLKGLYAAAYNVVTAGADEKEVEDIVFPLYKSLVHTVQAKVAASQKPRPMFLTNGGDWRSHLRAKKLDKFVEAVLHQPQGRYLNGWQVALDVFIDCLIWGVGFIKVFADAEEERIVLERVFPFEVYCDMQEARGGNPLNLFHVYPADKDIALATFVPEFDSKKDYEPDDPTWIKATAIEQAEPIDDEDEIYGGTRRVAQQIRLREAWRLPASSKAPGKHAICVENVALVEEDWERPDFPLVAMRWTSDRFGYFATGLVEESEPQIEEINRAAQRLQERMIIAASKRTYYKEGTVDTEALESNEAETLVAYTGDVPPIETAPTPFNPMEVDYLAFHFTKLYETSGVSRAAATAKKEPGVDSGVALQTLNDMQTELFAPKSRMNEDAFVSLGRQIVWTARELGGKLKVKLPGLTQLKTLVFKDADLEDDDFHIIVAPVSSMPNDPAGRIDLAEKMFNSGLIGPETQKRLAQMPDVEFELGRENAEHNYLEDVIDRFTHAEEGERVYESPEGFLSNKVAALVQFGQAYFDAKLHRAPEYVLELFRRYIKELDKMLTRAAEEAAKQQAQAAAAAAQPPAGAPGPAIGPGAPPLPPEGVPPGAMVN